MKEIFGFITMILFGVLISRFSIFLSQKLLGNKKDNKVDNTK